jgi:integrase
MSSQTGRIKTEYPGVYYRIAKRLGGKGTERVYYYKFKKNGKNIEEKAGREFADNMTPARTATKRGLRIEGKTPSPKERREAKKAENLTAANKWTIEKLWDEYKKHKEDNKSFRTDKGRYENYLKGSFGNKEPSKILQLEVDRLRIKLLKKRSPQTVKHILAQLNRIIKFGTDRGLCSSLPFTIKLPKVNNKKTEDLAPDELDALLKAIESDPHKQAGQIMKMALFTGMRKGEIFRLKWRDIDFHRGFIFIRNPKGGTDQKIPLNDGIRELLQGIKETKSPFVFPGREGKQRVDINHQVRRIANAAGLPRDFRPLHGLRHTYASMLASSGLVDLYTLQKLLTHKDHRMTERYAHLRDDALIKAAGVAGDIISQAMNGNKESKVANLEDKRK